MSVTPRVRLCAPFFPAPPTGLAPTGFQFIARMLARTAQRPSGGPRLCLTCRSGAYPLFPAILLTKLTDDPHPLPVLPPRIIAVQVRTRFPSAGPVAAMPATRRKAVTPTATAPMTEKMSCQVSDGIMCLTIPSVA